MDKQAFDLEDRLVDFAVRNACRRQKQVGILPDSLFGAEHLLPQIMEKHKVQNLAMILFTK